MSRIRDNGPQRVKRVFLSIINNLIIEYIQGCIQKMWLGGQIECFQNVGEKVYTTSYFPKV